MSALTISLNRKEGVDDLAIDHISVKVFHEATSGGSTATTTSYMHLDHLGSTNAVTDEDGILMQTLDYYPFGSPRIKTGTDMSQREYIGEHFDEETDLSYLNARYYEGSRGQFLGQDGVFWEVGFNKQSLEFLADPQQMNSYSYGGNNPIRFSDPTGRCPACVLAAPYAISGARLLWAAVGTAAITTGTAIINNYLRNSSQNRWREEIGVPEVPYTIEVGPWVPTDPKFPDPDKLPKFGRWAIGSIITGAVINRIVEIFEDYKEEDEFTREYEKKTEEFLRPTNAPGSATVRFTQNSSSASSLNSQQTASIGAQLRQIQDQINAIRNQINDLNK